MNKHIEFLKKNGIYYTNMFLAQAMIKQLDINYLDDFSIAELAVGEGHILKYIISEYLKLNKSKSIKQKIKFLENNIFAFDNRAEAIKVCKLELDKVAKRYFKKNVNIRWNIQKIDILDEKKLNKYLNAYDYIISNPPYIAKKNLDSKTIFKLEKQSQFCNKYNYNFYYYFIEIGFKLWNKHGKMVFITPNSYIKSKSAGKMNRFLLNGRYFNKIIDFQDKLMFENASTFTAITVFSSNNEEIKIVDDTGSIISEKQYSQIKASDLNPFYSLQLHRSNCGLSKISKIRTGIATLQDKIFILPDKNIIRKGRKYCIIKNKNRLFKIERQLLKTCIRPSDVEGKYYALFPYEKNINGNFEVISNFKNKFPYAYKYLFTLLPENYKKKYGYSWGRRQGIYDYESQKIIISRNARLYARPFHIVNKGFIISGIYLIPKDMDQIFMLAKYLNSNYIQKILDLLSKNYVQGYRSLSSSLLKKLPVIK